MLGVLVTLLQALVFTTAAAAPAIADDSSAAERNVAEARGVVTQFAGMLKPLLQSEIQAVGPVNAIHVCAEKAPELAQTLREETGWHIRRVSLQPRNPGARPDVWETEQLRQFAAERRAGAAPSELNTYLLGADTFRYMQAQITDGLCLLCHGDSLDPAIEHALQQRYPEDKATGYKLGDVRGAISLSKRVAPVDNDAVGSP